MIDQKFEYPILLFIAGITLIIYYGKQKPDPNDSAGYRVRQIMLGVGCIIGAIITLCKAL